jgi:predicted dinucleotide-utilizing enzyme
MIVKIFFCFQKMLKLTRRILFQKGARSRSKVTVMDPKQKIAQIEQLSRELDVLLDQATANAPEKIQESVNALQADKQKLIYQVQALKIH